MGRSNEKSKLATLRVKKITTSQMKRWGVKYHKVIFGKPSFDLFVDDKGFGFQKSWVNKIDKFLKIK